MTPNSGRMFERRLALRDQEVARENLDKYTGSLK